MSFIQLVEFKTARIDAMFELDQKWRNATEGKRTATAATMTRDRDKPDTYLWLIEFPSHEAATQNAQLPETQAISQEMMKVCDGEPTFRNLEVIERRDL
jgi:quinol monooxygenase YgiN